jgi:[ribosomal protein S5]-alanine N-acetyltransferase
MRPWGKADTMGVPGRPPAMSAPRKLATDRVILQAPQMGDVEAIYERYASDPEVTRYLGWPRHESTADTTRFVEFALQSWDRDGFGPYLIFTEEGGTLLGSTGLTPESPEAVLVGYVLAHDAWGLGYATDALEAMVDLAQLLGQARAICAECHLDHEASARVLLKAGFTPDPISNRQTRFPNLPGAPLLPVRRYRLPL